MMNDRNIGSVDNDRNYTNARNEMINKGLYDIYINPKITGYTFFENDLRKYLSGYVRKINMSLQINRQKSITF